jgi:hypothetical protein
MCTSFVLFGFAINALRANAAQNQFLFEQLSWEFCSR